jgi:hypothetical protein
MDPLVTTDAAAGPLGPVLLFLAASDRLDPDKVAEHGMALLILDDPHYVDARVHELHEAIRGLGHERYFSVNTRAPVPRETMVAYDVSDAGWAGFDDYDETGFSPRTTSTLFFTLPVSFLLLREGGVEPIWLCGPEPFIRSVVGPTLPEPLPRSFGSFRAGHPALTEPAVPRV